MAPIQLDVSNVKSLEPLAIGEYPVLVEDVALGVVKESDEPLVTFVLVVFDHDNAGRRLWLRHTLSNKESSSGFTPMSFFARTIAALTGEDITADGETWTFDESGYIGATAIAHVTKYEFGGEWRNDVSRLTPYIVPDDEDEQGELPL